MNAADLQAIACSVLGPIEWLDAVTGYCRCKGEARHTTPTHRRDCRVFLDKAPTIHCLHTSCESETATANKALRSAIGKAQVANGIKPYEPTEEDRERERKRIAHERLKARSVASLAELLKQFEKSPADFFEESPERLTEDPALDWRLLLQLFNLGEVLWIGNKYDSCGDDEPESEKNRCRQHFRTVEAWLNENEPCGQLICPSVFKPGSHSRSNANVVTRRFLVIESDALTKEQMAAVINWCRQFMKLRAIVDTGKRSLHGWFSAPPAEVEDELRTILPNLGRRPEDKPTLDPALFKLAQPCRIPGAWREPNKSRQALLYLDLQEAQ